MESSQVKALHERTRSNVPALLINLAGVVVGIATLATGWPTAHWGWTVGAIIWLSYFQHTWMMIFHADVHYALYEGKWHNIRSGIIVGTFLMVPFSVYQAMHLHHHKHSLDPNDWELWPYCDPRRSLAFRRIFVVLDILLGTFVGLYIYNRIFFVKHSPIHDRKLRRFIWMQYLIILVFWGAIWGVVAYYNAWWLFAKIYLIPAWLTGTIQTIRKLTEHLGLPAGPAMFAARTVMPESTVGHAINYTSLGVPGHGVHHRYPKMPMNHLRQAYELQSDEVQGAPVFRTHTAAVIDMCRYLFNPGAGVNAPVALGPGEYSENDSG
ncbi:MAG: fatty acid desaturase family protein [Planctomycetota bacterium]|jgi:fatty acid desaturase